MVTIPKNSSMFSEWNRKIHQLRVNDHWKALAKGKDHIPALKEAESELGSGSAES